MSNMERIRWYETNKKKSVELVNNLNEVSKKPLAALDNKCRRNLVRYSKNDYCVFSALDVPVKFDLELQKISNWVLLPCAL